MVNIEIIDFYPIEKNDDKCVLKGTLRIRLSDIGIHILGIFVSKRKDSWFFTMPGRTGVHHETNLLVRYPYIVFEDREKQQELMAAIREHGRVFIEKRLTDTENPLIFPQNKQQQPQHKALTKAPDNKSSAKDQPLLRNQNQ